MNLKKSLGQNFFNNPTLADKICALVVSKQPTKILEIGPGDGYFTKRFVDLNQKVVAIEKDDVLSHHLEIKLPEIQVINSDFFDVNISEIALGENPVVYGSLPYNVSKFIIRELLEKTDIKHFYFIIQKEVALKYQGEKNSSLQFITTKLFADSKVQFHISPGSFIPRPKVESSFIHLQRNTNSLNIDTNLFLKIVKKAFTNPRKTLKNNFQGMNIGEKAASKYYTKRAQELTFDDFMEIYNSIKMI
jgi:16S rRNA (adenine1518-N6/adenine1519-N6)-dimethyltransferase